MRILLAVALAMLLGSGASAQDWTLPRLSDAGLRDWERPVATQAPGARRGLRRSAAPRGEGAGGREFKEQSDAR